jgi:hypothetical protein
MEDEAPCAEDDPCWDCTVMGNRTCGPGHCLGAFAGVIGDALDDSDWWDRDLNLVSCALTA